MLVLTVPVLGRTRRKARLALVPGRSLLGGPSLLPGLVLLAPILIASSALLAGCAGPGEAEKKDERRSQAQQLAQAFHDYVDVYYGARLAAERKEAGPSRAVRLRVHEDLQRALEGVGVDLPAGADDAASLKAAVSAVRMTLVSNDFVFLPLGQGGETEDDDLGIALAHVRSRDPARSKELWGRTIEYKRILYEPFILDYPGWKARALGVEGPVYSPGRFSGSTVYIDHTELVKRAGTLRAPYDHLGLEGLIGEVELRQAAYLLFIRDIPPAATRDPDARRAAIARLHERVLWTAVRYGDPDAALADVRGLASNEQAPAELRAAAQQVGAAIPAGTGDLPSKEKRAQVLHDLAEEVWRRRSLGRG